MLVRPTAGLSSALVARSQAPAAATLRCGAIQRMASTCPVVGRQVTRTTFGSTAARGTAGRISTQAAPCHRGGITRLPSGATLWTASSSMAVGAARRTFGSTAARPGECNTQSTCIYRTKQYNTDDTIQYNNQHHMQERLTGQ